MKRGQIHELNSGLFHSSPGPRIVEAVAAVAELVKAAAPQQPAAETSAYPLAVTDMLGRPVEIPVAPQRIVTISPAGTEMLYAVGGTAVARDSSSRYPAAVTELPAVGGAYAPSMEAIAAQQPDSS